MGSSNLGNYIYIGTGIFGILFNALIVLSIFRAKRLRRKENFLIAGLSIFSLFYSLHSLSTGAYRLNVNPIAQVPISYCLKLPMSAATVFAPVGCSCMLFMISLDRLIAAHWFQKYLTLGNAYSVKVVCSVSVFSLVCTLAGYLGSIFQLSGTFVSTYCYILFTNWFLYAYTYADLFINCCTILLYMLTLSVIWYRTKHAHSSVQVVQYKHQRSITIKLSIVIFSMLFLHMFPRLAMSMGWSFMNSIAMQQIMYSAIGVHTALQVMFYAMIKKEFRSEMIRVLCCKKIQVFNATLLVTPQHPIHITNGETNF